MQTGSTVDPSDLQRARSNNGSSAHLMSEPMAMGQSGMLQKSSGDHVSALWRQSCHLNLLSNQKFSRDVFFHSKVDMALPCIGAVCRVLHMRRVQAMYALNLEELHRLNDASACVCSNCQRCAWNSRGPHPAAARRTLHCAQHALSSPRTSPGPWHTAAQQGAYRATPLVLLQAACSAAIRASSLAWDSRPPICW